jgi:hypothetical protein
MVKLNLDDSVDIPSWDIPVDLPSNEATGTFVDALRRQFSSSPILLSFLSDYLTQDWLLILLISIITLIPVLFIRLKSFRSFVLPFIPKNKQYELLLHQIHDLEDEIVDVESQLDNIKSNMFSFADPPQTSLTDSIENKVDTSPEPTADSLIQSIEQAKGDISYREKSHQSKSHRDKSEGRKMDDKRSQLISRLSGLRDGLHKAYEKNEQMVFQRRAREFDKVWTFVLLSFVGLGLLLSLYSSKESYHAICYSARSASALEMVQVKFGLCLDVPIPSFSTLRDPKMNIVEEYLDIQWAWPYVTALFEPKHHSETSWSPIDFSFIHAMQRWFIWMEIYIYVASLVFIIYVLSRINPFAPLLALGSYLLFISKSSLIRFLSKLPFTVATIVFVHSSCFLFFVLSDPNEFPDDSFFRYLQVVAGNTPSMRQKSGTWTRQDSVTLHKLFLDFIWPLAAILASVVAFSYMAGVSSSMSASLMFHLVEGVVTPRRT